MSDATWSERLRRARRGAGLTQTEVARIAGLSMQTVRAYERRRRHPTRPRLVAILDALHVAWAERNAILTTAGYAPDGHGPGAQRPIAGCTRAEAAGELAHYSWPVFMLDPYGTVVAANAATQRLWGIDLPRESGERSGRNVLTVLADPRFSDRLLNWDAAATRMIAMFKGNHRGAAGIDDGEPQFRAVLNRLLCGDAGYAARLLRLWQTTAATAARTRWSYPIVWRGPAGEALRFHGFASPADEDAGLLFHDWIPLDGAAWAGLAALGGC